MNHYIQLIRSRTDLWCGSAWWVVVLASWPLSWRARHWEIQEELAAKGSLDPGREAFEQACQKLGISLERTP